MLDPTGFVGANELVSQEDPRNAERAVDARVLEKPAKDAHDPNALGQAGNAGAEAAAALTNAAAKAPSASLRKLAPVIE